MTNIDDIIKQLEEERNRYDRAIQVLAGIRSGTISNRRPTKVTSLALRRKLARATGRRTMSAAARARISAAQKARWAKSRGQQKVVPIASKGKRRISAAGRARIAAAARARWAKVRAAAKK